MADRMIEVSESDVRLILSVFEDYESEAGHGALDVAAPGVKARLEQSLATPAMHSSSENLDERLQTGWKGWERGVRGE